MKTSAFDGVEAFLAVAELRSFTGAAARLGITPTAVSKAVKLLERRHGVILFQRTTRNVAPTEAGLALFAGMRPAAAQIGDAFAALNLYRDSPSGTLRLTVPRALGPMVLTPLVTRMRRACPDVKFDISLDDGAVDLLARGFDAGIRIGESVAQDMVALRLTPDLLWSVVGAPAYFDDSGVPATPEQLVEHETIRYRFLTSGAVARWKFIRDGRAFHVETGGALVVNDTTLIAQFVRHGLGLAYLPEIEIAPDLTAGRLLRVLQPFMPPTSGLYLYFPQSTQHQPKLRALIDMAASLRDGK